MLSHIDTGEMGGYVKPVSPIVASGQAGILANLSLKTAFKST